MLTGGAADLFVFSALAESRDRINDLRVDDFIELSAADFSGGLFSEE